MVRRRLIVSKLQSWPTHRGQIRQARTPRGTFLDPHPPRSEVRHHLPQVSARWRRTLSSYLFSRFGEHNLVRRCSPVALMVVKFVREPSLRLFMDSRMRCSTTMVRLRKFAVPCMTLGAPKGRLPDG